MQRNQIIHDAGKGVKGILFEQGELVPAKYHNWRFDARLQLDISHYINNNSNVVAYNVLHDL